MPLDELRAAIFMIEEKVVSLTLRYSSVAGKESFTFHNW